MPDTPEQHVPAAKRKTRLLAVSLAAAAIIVCIGVLGWHMRSAGRAEQSRREISQANALAEQGDYPGAVRILEEIAQEQQGTETAAEALLRIGGMWQAAHEYRKADAVYKRLLTDYPGSRWRSGAEAELSLSAIRKSRKVPLREDPVAAEFSSAARLENDRDYDGAAARFEDLARVNPKHELAPFALLEAGNCHFLAGRSQDAEIRWRQVIERYPNSAWRTDADFALRAMKSPKLRESLRKILAE